MTQQRLACLLKTCYYLHISIRQKACHAKAFCPQSSGGPYIAFRRRQRNLICPKRDESVPWVHSWMYLLRQPEQMLSVHPSLRGYRGKTECPPASGTRPTVQKKKMHDRNRCHVRPLHALRRAAGPDQEMPGNHSPLRLRRDHSDQIPPDPAGSGSAETHSRKRQVCGADDTDHL